MFRSWTVHNRQPNVQGPANVDAIGLLVELGANLWSVMKDVDMETPLHMASRSGRLDIVEKLLRCGADLNKKTKVKSTAMPYASLKQTCTVIVDHITAAVTRCAVQQLYVKRKPTASVSCSLHELNTAYLSVLSILLRGCRKVP